MTGSNDLFCFRRVTCHEVKDAMDKLNSSKAVGYDGIQPRVLKLVAEELTPSLITISNSSIHQGEWITPWKRGEWVPVFKNEYRREVRNHRPAQCYRLWERFTKNSEAANNWVLSIQIQNWATPYQLRGRTLVVKVRLLRLVENWKKDLDRKRVFGFLSSDISKAFDYQSCPFWSKS